MAVCRQDMLYKDYTTNPIPTSFFIPDMILLAMHAIRLLRIAVCSGVARNLFYMRHSAGANFMGDL